MAQNQVRGGSRDPLLGMLKGGACSGRLCRRRRELDLGAVLRPLAEAGAEKPHHSRSSRRRWVVPSVYEPDRRPPPAARRPPPAPRTPRTVASAGRSVPLAVPTL